MSKIESSAGKALYEQQETKLSQQSAAFIELLTKRGILGDSSIDDDRVRQAKKEKKMYKLILASQSPRRRELLKMLGIEFDIKVSNCEEIITSSEPAQVTMELAKQKALAVANELVKQKALPHTSAEIVMIPMSAITPSRAVINGTRDTL